jgi:hypothetical protein
VLFDTFLERSKPDAASRNSAEPTLIDNPMHLFIFALLHLVCADVPLADTVGLVPVAGVNKTMAFSTNASWPYAHNSGWAILPSGRIAVVYQASSSREGAASQQILLSTSEDGGASFPAPPRIIAGNGSASVWAPAIFADGPLVRVFYAQAPIARPTQLCGDIMHIASTDGGRSWEAPQLVLAQAAWGGGLKCTDNKPVRVATDQWALPFMSVLGSGDPRDEAPAGLVGSAKGAGMGGPWAPLAGRIASPPHYNTTDYLSEPAIATCGDPADGCLLALLRNYEFTWASHSLDGGASWGAAYATPLTNPYSKVDLAVWAAPSQEGHEEGLASAGPRSGALLLAHNPVVNCTKPSYCARSPLGASWSPDCGATWSRPLLIEPTDLNPYGASYPTIGPCGSSRVCVSYTLYGPAANDNPSSFLGIAFASFYISSLPPIAET